MMKHYLLGICFLASIGTTCFDAYCMSIRDEEGKKYFVFDENTLNNQQNRLIENAADTLIKNGHFGIDTVNQCEMSFSNNSGMCINRVFTNLSRPVFHISNKVLLITDKIPEISSSSRNIRKIAIEVTKKILKSFDQVSLSIIKGTYIAKNILFYGTDQQQIEMRLKVKDGNIVNIILDLDKFKSFQEVKRELTENNSVDLLSDIIVENKLLDRESLMEHMVDHGHLGSLPFHEIDNTVPFSIYTTDDGTKQVKLNTGDFRNYCEPVPRGMFILNNKRRLTREHQRQNCNYVLSEIKRLIMQKLFNIKSCTPGNGKSLEVIIEFEEPISNVQAVYASEYNKNTLYPCKTVCFYLRHDGSYNITSLFPVKDKEELWDHEEYNPNNDELNKYSGRQANNAKTAIRYLSYGDKDAAKKYLQHVMITQQFSELEKMTKSQLSQWENLVFCFMKNVDIVKCTTETRTEDIVVIANYNDRNVPKTAVLKFTYDPKTHNLVIREFTVG